VSKIEAKEIFNGKVEFLYSVNNPEQFPSYHFPEIAFIGASNVGKSSLINSLVQKKIAITSNTPGRTKQLNFFKLFGYKDGFIMVDMPGYGFARDSKKNIAHWQNLSLNYLANRKNLKKVFLLIEAQKQLKDHDRDIIKFFNIYSVDYQIILTKIDKLNRADQIQILEKIEKELSMLIHKKPKIIATSASGKYGIDDLQNEIIKLLLNL
jgi:GTP-binding protein